MKDARTIAGRLFRRVRDLREKITIAARELIIKWKPLGAVRGFAKCAENLAHYLAFRRHDLRGLQHELAMLGVSSLGRCEAHVIPTLNAVTATLAAISGEQSERVPHPSHREFTDPDRILSRHAESLLGPLADEDTVRIMVTLPTEAATRRAWVRELIEAGTDCVRINCAHDEPATWLKMIRNVRAASSTTGRACRVMMDLTGPRARTENVLTPGEDSRVCVRDRILLTRGVPVPRADFHFQARCSLPEVFADLTTRRLVCFNEGKIAAEVEQLSSLGASLRVVAARPQGEKFRADMALNFPGTELHIPSLTPKDLSDLDFVVKHADLVGYSFVQTGADIAQLLDELDLRRARIGRKSKLGVVAKIETDRAVRNLPEIIVRAAGHGPFGVMIARGDLAVEVGFLRVAELQEEILWICEAARVPVIWATQVLETMAKKGIPTRAEISDAALAEQAECVMLNKGPFILDAVRTLDSVLRRMAGHHHKKTPTLRALHAWDHLSL